MKTTLLAKATMCVCPPALVATAVATVPPVKRAVHHLTAPSRPAAKAAPRRAVVKKATFAAIPCAPVADFDFIDSLPLETVPSTLESIGTPPPLAPLPPPIAPVPPTIVIRRPPTDFGAVPEPATWVMLITGFGAVGVAMRVRRRRRVADPAPATPASPERALVVVPQRRERYRVSRSGRPIGWRRFMGGAGLALLPGRGGAVASVASKTAQTTLLTKAALCVCPAVVLATTAATVPPIRNAIHQVTAPAVPYVAPATPVMTASCLT
jgi:hypothetical protein